MSLPYVEYSDIAGLRQDSNPKYVIIRKREYLAPLLTGNNIKGVRINYNAEALPSWFYRLKLERLSIRFGAPSLILTAAIGRITTLKSLTFSTNNLKAIPPEIKYCTELVFLDLSNNKLASIPPEIGQLKNLRELWLHDNWLTSLPPEIGQLSNLRELWLHGNRLTSFPPEIRHLRYLHCLIDNFLNIGQNFREAKIYLLTRLKEQPPRLSRVEKTVANQYKRRRRITLLHIEAAIAYAD